MWLLDLALHESEGLAHPLQGDPVLTTDGPQDVRLHEILKGQQAAARGELDDRLSLTSVLVDATMNPGFQGGAGQAQVESRLADRVARYRARVLPAVEVDHFAHVSKVP